MFEASQHNPFRPPDWRFKRARWLIQSKKQARLVQDDAITKAVRRYLMLKDKCKDDTDIMALESKFPGIFWADEIYRTENMDTRWSVEARLLSRQSLEDIASKCNTTAETIMWYERVFFNVIPHLDRLDYIVNVVMGQSVHSGLYERDYDLLWKMLGYSYGPIFLDALILPVTNPARVNNPSEINAAWVDHNKGAMHRKAGIALQTIPVAYNQVSIIQLYNEAIKIERDSESGGGGVASQITSNIQAALTCLPFRAGKATVEGRVQILPEMLGYYDKQSVELRANEMINVALGQEDMVVRDKIANIKFPEVEHATPGT